MNLIKLFTKFYQSPTKTIIETKYVPEQELPFCSDFFFERSPEWNSIRQDYWKSHKKICPFCQTTQDIELHHILPVHEFPQFELSSWNFLPACRRDHYTICHFSNWKLYNPWAFQWAQSISKAYIPPNKSFLDATINLLMEKNK